MPRQPAVRVALVELDGSHSETLYSHAVLLHQLGYTVDLIVREEVRRKLGDPGPVERVDCFDLEPSLPGAIRHARSLARDLLARGVRTVVLNTAEGRRARNFCLVAPRALRVVGVLHNAHKLRRSYTQFWITRRVEGYFVLSETIARNVGPCRVPVRPFYPIYFPPIATSPETNDRFEVVIPGRLDPRRRDYPSLVRELSYGTLHPAVRIVALGDGSGSRGVAVREMLGKTGIGDRVEVSTGFVDESALLRRVAHASAILPLVTPRVSEFAHYRTSKIVGAYNLAYGTHVPMLSHASLSDQEELAVASVFYEDGGLVERINELAGAPDRLRAKRAAISAYPGFAPEVQRRRYGEILAPSAD